MSWFEQGTSHVYFEDTGKGEVVLMLPGFASSIEELAELREALVTAGYRVIAADLPGSGRSGPQPRYYSTSYYEDDARTFVALLQHLAVDAAHLMGHSDGGEVSLLLAAIMPDYARSVVTWGTAGMICDPKGEYRDALYNVIDNPIPPMQGFKDYLVANYGEANARAMTQSLVKALNGIVGGGGYISHLKASQITCPVLLLTGEHDHLAPSSLLAQLAKRIARAEVIMVDGAGHDTYGHDPAWFTSTILDWLKRV